MNFLKHLKNLSSTSKYVEISTGALFNAMEKLQIDQKSGDLLRVLWKFSEVFFQLKTNQKQIYNVIIRPKLIVVGKREDSKFYPLPQPPYLPPPHGWRDQGPKYRDFKRKFRIQVALKIFRRIV